MRINKVKPLRMRRNILINFKMVLNNFGFCNPDISVLELKKCSKDRTGSMKLNIRCEIRDASCRFKLACRMDPILGIQCQKGQHIYTSIFCCNFFCISKRFQVKPVKAIIG